MNPQTRRDGTESRSARPRWLARGAVAAILLAAAGCAIAFRLGAEKFGLVGRLQYLPYPIPLALALAALGVSLRLGTTWRAAAGASLGLVAIPIMGLELNTGEPGLDRIRLMTYNVKGYLAIHRPEGFLPIAREIALHDADVIVLQDALDLTEMEERSPGVSRALFGAHHVFSHGEYVVASRFPFRGCKTQRTPTGQRPFIYVHCTVDARGMELDVVTAHLMSPRPALGSWRDALFRADGRWTENVTLRLVQAEALAALARARERPMILAGDLNAPASSVVLRGLLAAGLRNAFSVAGAGYGHSWGHSVQPGISFLRIDHILASAEIGVIDCFVGGAAASAHRPVIADLYLRRLPA